MNFTGCIECGNPVIEAFGLCASCNGRKRKSDRDSKKAALKAPPKKIAKFSAKMKTERVSYEKLSREYLKGHPDCGVKIPGLCTNRATTIHHAAKRGKNYLNVATWIGACFQCHDFLETRMSATERRLRGLLI